MGNEIVSMKTGEVMDDLDYVRNGAPDPERERLKELAEAKIEAARKELMNRKGQELLKSLDGVKDDKWEKQEEDFWKPEEAFIRNMNKPVELRGIYMGKVKEGKLWQHLLARPGQKKDKPVIWRVNGATILNRELEKVDVGTPTRIVYSGKAGRTLGGQNIAGWEVFTFELKD